MAKNHSKESVKIDIADKADELSLQMYHLKQAISVAAFATEARRVLVCIDDYLAKRPGAEKEMGDVIKCRNQWSEMQDDVSGMLEHLADEMERVNGEMMQLAYAAKA